MPWGRAVASSQHHNPNWYAGPTEYPSARSANGLRAIPAASVVFVCASRRPMPTLPRMKVGIVGLGYLALPLAASFAEAGHDVVAVDSSSAKVERLRRSESDVVD